MRTFPIIPNYASEHLIRMQLDTFSLHEDGFFGISFRIEKEILRTYEFYYVTLF